MANSLEVSQNARLWSAGGNQRFRRETAQEEHANSTQADGFKPRNVLL